MKLLPHWGFLQMLPVANSVTVVESPGRPRTCGICGLRGATGVVVVGAGVVIAVVGWNPVAS